MTVEKPAATQRASLCLSPIFAALIKAMALNTVIFDMDGLLINSEPLWNEAANEIFSLYGIALSDEEYLLTTGLRTREFVEWWISQFDIKGVNVLEIEEMIFNAVIHKVANTPAAMPGLEYIFDFFNSRKFKIGIASSSPLELIDLVVNKYGLEDYVKHHASAHLLKHAKPHPEVYLNCAEMLGAHPLECICFEDSFNGMIAAKAARMKCVVVPAQSQQQQACWGAADIALTSLEEFGEKELQRMQ
jgi:HAD superfamily hydrolase (TIGR01509 family)